jgi:hypothetical protein
MDEYNQTSYATLEKAIFPSYFHGKCLHNGIEPPGCPNPNCPIVCGTPGSLVHFYSKLRLIAFNCVRALLESLTSPNGVHYQSLEDHIIADTSRAGKRMARIARGSSLALHLEERSTDVTNSLKHILTEVGPVFEKECDGAVAGSLTKCSWEHEMKEYILTFP